ncbi:uncharacterized protein LOC119373585 [Rhipicephalus sanguineus]|uniref:uncharacterized protein LOC119373585 n=1 Tax=Rhipicephalus sanguineus TaxID=34632 RepID=UPI0020C56C59|nr:uncharacterized protein LOC119373585 [Rhipicephalus sanguineus]
MHSLLQGFRAQSRNMINVCLVWSASLFVSNVRYQPHGIPSRCRLPCQHKECRNRNRRPLATSLQRRLLRRRFVDDTACSSLPLWDEQLFPSLEPSPNEIGGSAQCCYGSNNCACY